MNTNPYVASFLEEVISVCKKHGISISHEDYHGAFVVEDYSEEATEWLRGATDETTMAREE